MKKTLLVLALVFVLVATLTVTVFALAPNDEGVYEIGSAEDLIEFKDLANGKGKKYTAKLTADIDLTGKNWTPILVFDGTFDGNGKTISGIQIEQAFDSDGYGYGMLIRDLEDGGVVKNLTLKDSSLKLTTNQTTNGRNHIGGVVGWAMRAHFENVHIKNVDVSFTGTVKNEVNVGGIVGTMDSNNAVTGAISVHNCSSDKDCSVEGVTTGRLPNVAGLVGRLKNTGSNNKLDMKDCVNNAAVSSSDWAGGLVACIDDTVKGGNVITNCQNYGTIKTTGEAAAALVASAGNNTALSVKDSIAGGIVISDNKYAAVCAVNNNAVTVENTKETAIFNPSLTVDEAGVYLIASADDLILFRNIASIGKDDARKAYRAVLTADIDMTGKEWVPFDRVIMNFDGQGHTISGITVTNTAATWETGAFANLIINGDGMHSTVKNVIFKDCTYNVTMAGGSQCIGIVAGYADRAAVYDVELKNCDINIDGTGAETIVGTIVGRAAWEHNDFGTAAVGGKVDADSVITVAEGTTFTGEKRFAGIVGACSQAITVINPEYKGSIEGVDRKASFVSDIWNTVIFLGYDEGAQTYNNLHNWCSTIKYVPNVSTADELLAAVAKINAQEGKKQLGFYLTADIDLTGKEWTPITGQFVGIIDGGNHTISGITLNYTDAEAGFYGIIANELSNASGWNGTVQNLTIKDSSLAVSLKEGASGNAFVGGVTGQYDRGHINGITLENVGIALVGNPGGEIGVGGAVGKAQWAGPKGHISVYGVTTDKNCSVFVDAGESTNARAGGIVGRKGSIDQLFINNCVNNATVYSTHTAAGIIGACYERDDNRIENCKNYGNIYGKEIAASVMAVCDSGNAVVKNIVAGGFISGENEVHNAFRTEVSKENVKVVSIKVDATEEGDVLAYYQTRAADEGKVDIRVIFLADVEYLVANTDLAIKVEFKKDDAVIKTYNGTLGSEVYKSVTADGDVYHGSDEIVMFGNIFTDVPTAEVNGFTITVTDGTGATVCSGAGTLGE